MNKFIISIFIFTCAISLTKTDEVETNSTNLSDIPPPQEWRQVMPQVEVEPQSSNGSQKIPELLTEEEPQKKRRRNGRKRRRRPQLFMLQDEQWPDDDAGFMQDRDPFRENDWKPRPSPDRPTKEFLEWDNPRRPQKQENYKNHQKHHYSIATKANSFEEDMPSRHHEDPEEIMITSEEPTRHDKSYRKPYALKKIEEQRQAEEELSPAAKLKSILKQAGGLSLSEVLQQRNVTLADLLKGKQGAFAAIVSTTKPGQQQPESNESESKEDDDDDMDEMDKSEESNESHREQKEFKIRNYKRPKPRPEPVEEDEDEEETPVRRIPTYKTQKHKHTNNLEEETDSREDVFPTQEVKQMTLHPVVPVDRGEKRPIKYIVPKIRPDFSNSKSKNEESFENSRRRNQPSKLVGSSTLPPSTTPRERWTPNSSNRDRLPSRIPYRSTVKPSEADSNPSASKPETVDDVPPTTSAPSSAKATRSSTISTTPKNMDVIRNRLSVKPRIRLPARPSRVRTSTTTESSTVVETEKVTEEMITTTKGQEEADVNVIEKFTSYEDAKPKNVETIEQIFPSRNERIPPSRVKKITEKAKESAEKNKIPEVVEVTEVVLPSLLADLIGPDVEEEKNEIIQILEDRRNGGKLTKVLEQRNMTVDELMEHRQRGSSHLHLTELLKNKQKLAELASKMEDRVDIVTAFENFPKFDLKGVKQDNMKTDSQGFSYFTSIINIRPTDEIYKEARALQDIATLEKVTNRQFKTLSFPIETKSSDGVIQKLGDQKSTATSDEHIVHHIEQELKRVHDGSVKPKVKIENTSQSGIKSAIVASMCIVAVSIVVFVCIFGIFRWRQRQRTKLNYTESYKIAKGRLPIMHTKEALKDTVSPVLCAKHRHSSRLARMGTMDPNSPEIHEYLGWDHMKKPFQ